METADIFSNLVWYHQQVNLPTCSRYIKNGRLYSPVTNQPLQEGNDKNQVYHGFLIVANGETLVDKLLGERIVLDGEIEPFHSIPDQSTFFSYLSKQEEDGEDGAFIYDGKNKAITRVFELNNTPGKLNDPQYSSFQGAIPADFFTSTREQKPLGTKTRLAIKLPRAYPDVHAFQIKRSAYTPLGLGKVTHFRDYGLAEEFFFRPGSNNTIDGVYRRYRPQEGKVVLAQETVTPIEIPKSLEEKVRTAV